MSNLDYYINKYLNFFNHHKINLKSNFLIGVSGGLDSMALLDLSFKTGLKISVAHVNYQLRGSENNREIKIIEEYCQERKINLFIKTTEINKNKNLQNEARIVRYQFFNELINQEGLDYIITAHHQNDNHETFLFNAFRGNGINSLKGIQKINTIILRPGLEFSKKEFEEYAKLNTINFNIDSSNLTSKYDRNFIRNKLLKLVSTQFPNYEKALSNTIKYLNEDYILLNYLVEEKLENYISEEKNYVKIQYDYTIPSYFWTHYLRKYGFKNHQISKWIESPSQVGKYIESANFQLLNDRNYWLLRPKKMEKKDLKEYYLNENQAIHYPIFLSGKISKTRKIKTRSENFENVDYSKLKFPLLLRKWRKGDKIQPLGMKGSKKISDFLIERKVPLFEKKNIYVLISNEDIIWVIGYVISEKVKIREKSKMYYHLLYQE